MDIYIPKAVEQIRDFYGELLDQSLFPSVGSHLDALALKMWDGVRAGRESVFREISNYHRAHLGRTSEVLSSLGLTEADCRQTIANEYGFATWSDVGEVAIPYDMSYENTVDALLAGKAALVGEYISKKPSLLNQSSGYGHKATLLHYAVCNGVEIWRQQVPLNLPDIVAFLLEKGAEPHAKMTVYGGAYTAAELLLSSLHLRNAGVFSELRYLLDT